MVPLKRKPQTVLITGASSGIGLALALEFHSRGLHVFATAREPSKMQHLADLGIRTLALEATSASSIAAAADLVSAETGGKLDYLVNNAGMGYSIPLLDSDLDVARRVYEINVFGLVAVTKAFAPLVIARKGKVANISSTASKAAIPYMGFYNGTKAAVNSISDTLRMELAVFDVKVLTVITGVIRTHFFDAQPDTTLPKDSLYRPIETEYTIFATEGDQHQMDVIKYAKGFVAHTLERNSSVYYWRGENAPAVKFATTFMPVWFADWVMGKAAKLNLLRGRLEEKVE